jgi:MtfA peptidase
MFGWLKDRKRAQLREAPFPETQRALIERRVPYYRTLPQDMQRQLLGHAAVLLAEKHFEGCGGFRLTDEAKVTIAGQAAVLLLNRDTDYFPHCTSILVYPEPFTVDIEEEGPDGVVSLDPDMRSGESWDQGVVILAWAEVVYSCESTDGFNVVLHEFAHQLDLEDGVVDGVPVLGRASFHARWGKVLSEGYQQLQRDVQRRRRTLIDDYGASDPAEFFAVITETFFQLPLALRNRHKDLYDALRDFYQQDPAAYLEQARKRDR